MKIKKETIKEAEQLLANYGVNDEASPVVLQSLGFLLLNKDLYDIVDMDDIPLSYETVTLGSYPQTATDASLPINWHILKSRGPYSLLVSIDVLEARIFDTKSNRWHDSDLRRWLNDYFYDHAFSDKEKRSIVETKETWKYCEYPSSDEIADDRVFCLSKRDAEQLYDVASRRRKKATEHAVKMGVEVYRWSNKVDWWLRSNAASSQRAFYSCRTGEPSIHDVNRISGVAPAVWADLSKLY